MRIGQETPRPEELSLIATIIPDRQFPPSIIGRTTVEVRDEGLPPPYLRHGRRSARRGRHSVVRYCSSPASSGRARERRYGDPASERVFDPIGSGSACPGRQWHVVQ